MAVVLKPWKVVIVKVAIHVSGEVPAVISSIENSFERTFIAITIASSHFGEIDFLPYISEVSFYYYIVVEEQQKLSPVPDITQLSDLAPYQSALG